jgi:hypothetical protein
MITINLCRGFISDDDETLQENDPERLALMNAPPKGKKRLTSNVSLRLVVTL